MEAVRWGPARKSSYSQGGSDNCVGVAWSADGAAVSVEDTKDPERARLVVSRVGFARLIEAACAGRLG